MNQEAFENALRDIQERVTAAESAIKDLVIAKAVIEKLLAEAPANPWPLPQRTTKRQPKPRQRRTYTRRRKINA